MQLAGASTVTRPLGEEQLPGVANYFIGSDPAGWHTNIPTFAKVRYAGVYPGIDLVYYGNQRQLEYDFAVAPGASPGVIRLELSGAKQLHVAANGDLVFMLGNGTLAFQKRWCTRSWMAIASRLRERLRYWETHGGIRLGVMTERDRL